ncbi:hypothetical protein QV13_18705 [Mesorhizobium hungaricum]|jgi:Cellulose biosynthesis protein BcsN|uniref:Cellulose biosynthesis protein BcsN n=2 Tax=Hyphomicrobiales TaxID=356 RepID=A0A1C2DK63_9HYPH|nr:hypothetical protein QV13_18705 [Mesorhizobium hungaricum]
MLAATGGMVALLLAGCAQPQIASSTDTQMMSAEKAFAYPGPGGPAITAVLERRYANAIQQEIALATSAHTSGQNMLRVQLFGPVDTKTTGQTRLRDGFLPPSNISTELRQLFPGIRMARSPYYVQNRYGPFGYAVGRSTAGDTCIYAWQRLTSTGSTQTLIGNKGSVQIRLRLCDQSLPEHRLLQTMYDFTISSYFQSSGWNPYGDANPPDPLLGKSGAPIYPAAAGGPAVPDVRPAPVAAPVRSSARGSPARTQQALPQPVGPVVPPPPVSGAPGAEIPQTTTGKQVVVPSPRAAVIVPPPPCDPTTTNCR